VNPRCVRNMRLWCSGTLLERGMRQYASRPIVKDLLEAGVRCRETRPSKRFIRPYLARSEDDWYRVPDAIIAARVVMVWTSVAHIETSGSAQRSRLSRITR